VGNGVSPLLGLTLPHFRFPLAGVTPRNGNSPWCFTKRVGSKAILESQSSPNGFLAGLLLVRRGFPVQFNDQGRAISGQLFVLTALDFLPRIGAPSGEQSSGVERWLLKSNTMALVLKSLRITRIERRFRYGEVLLTLSCVPVHTGRADCTSPDAVDNAATTESKHGP
jgi:hypothetical protein